MISKGANLPDDDHVMRYVPWTKLRKDENDQVIGFLAEAFLLKDGERSLSLNWLEYFAGDQSQRVRESVEMFRRVMKVGPKSAFGVGKVRKIKEVCNANGSRVRIVYEPDDNNPAHAGIRHLPREELSLLEALATEAFDEMVRNSEVPV